MAGHPLAMVGLENIDSESSVVGEYIGVKLA
jgi:hypothetical protein